MELRVVRSRHELHPIQHKKLCSSAVSVRGARNRLLEWDLTDDPPASLFVSFSFSLSLSLSPQSWRVWQISTRVTHGTKAPRNGIHPLDRRRLKRSIRVIGMLIGSRGF